MYKLIRKLSREPLSLGAGAVYPYDESLLASLQRKNRFDAEDTFCLGTVSGEGLGRRILVPRNMAPSVPGIADFRVKGDAINLVSTFKPRDDEQSRCVSEVLHHLKKGESFVFEAMTGLGKTVMTTHVITMLGIKTLVVVPREDILEQWVEAITMLTGLTVGKGVGLIQGNKCKVEGQSIVLSMIQSVCKMGRYPEGTFDSFGLLVLDEGHRIGADSFSQVCFNVPARLRLICSATPDRRDGREEVIEAHVGPTLVRSKAMPSIPKVIMRKSPWKIPQKRVFLPNGASLLDPSGNQVFKELEHTPTKCAHIVRMLTHSAQRNKMIASMALQAYKADRKILIQSDTKDHLDLLFEAINVAGVPKGLITYYVGGLSKKEREDAKKGCIILSTYAMSKEGMDIPELDTLIMATPKSDVRQIVGRILRILPGKKIPVVFDIVDSTSSVFSNYARNRLKWYTSIKAHIDSNT